MSGGGAHGLVLNAWGKPVSGPTLSRRETEPLPGQALGLFTELPDLGGVRGTLCFHQSLPGLHTVHPPNPTGKISLATCWDSHPPMEQFCLWGRAQATEDPSCSPSSSCSRGRGRQPLGGAPASWMAGLGWLGPHSTWWVVPVS